MKSWGQYALGFLYLQDISIVKRCKFFVLFVFTSLFFIRILYSCENEYMLATTLLGHGGVGVIMKTGLFLIFCIFASQATAGINIAKTRCTVESGADSTLYSSEFKNPANHLGSSWWWTIPELQSLFESVYTSGKRLPKRAYYDSHKKLFLAPLDDGSTATITENFILSVQKHIESAIKEKYAEFLFFPDMGHSHFYFPSEHWNKEYASFSGTRAERYTKMFADPELRSLYHTAEKLLMHDEEKHLLPDPHLQFRYNNRNIHGGNTQQTTLDILVEHDGGFNTVKNINGYDSWSAGINISSSKDGCFVYYIDGKEMYFDISLSDLVPDPNITSSDDYYL